MALSIRVLGRLVIASDDCHIGKLPKKGCALVAFLAVQRNQAISRERLADLLWPCQSSDEARHSLRNCLFVLRKAFGPTRARHLITDATSCRLVDIDLDLHRFEQLCVWPNTILTCRRRLICIRASFWPILISTLNHLANGLLPSATGHSTWFATSCAQTAAKVPGLFAYSLRVHC